MKVKCGNCGHIFNYEENNKVCPECKKFCALPENTKEKIKKKEEKEKKIKQEEENKIYPEPTLFKKREKKEKNIEEKEKIEKQKEVIESKPELKEAEDTIDLTNADDHKKSKKGFYIIITILLAIIILPISMRSDPTTLVDGTDGTLISSQVKEITLDEIFNSLFYIEKVGYTSSGNLYVLYESNIYGFADNGFEIKMAVTNVNGEYVELGCIGSDFLAQKNEVQVTYFTKALFNYTNEMPRITKLHIILNEQEIGVMEF